MRWSSYNPSLVALSEHNPQSTYYQIGIPKRDGVEILTEESSHWMMRRMILPIIRYGDPILRTKGEEITQISASVIRLAEDMIETMHEARGVGLAAQQVGKALQMTVIDVRGTDRASQLILGGRMADLETVMPLVLINPKILRQEGEEKGEEGCLSFPKLGGDVKRSATVHVEAFNIELKPFRFVATGLLSRAVQHEWDHLQGILYIDRMEPDQRKKIESDIRELETETKRLLKRRK
jgi:peptide deformylase